MLLPVCKTPGSDSAVLNSEIRSDQDAGPGPAPLLKFEYEVDKSLLKELGARIGCKQASEIVSYPTKGSLRFAIRKVILQGDIYSSLQSQFFNQRATESHCGSPAAKAKNSGVKKLRDLVVKNDPDTIFTIVIHGGFGDHLVFERALDPVIEDWFDLIDSEENPSLDMYQFSCSNSMAPSEVCAKEMLLSMKERRNQTPNKKRKFLLWGYSSGGITMLEALKLSEDLRNNTIGLVTLGSPIGGSVAMDLAGPLVQKTADSLVESLRMPEAIAKSLPSSVLFLAKNQINEEDFSGKIALLSNSESLAQVKKAAKELTSKARKSSLASDIANANYKRADGSDIPVYHLAGILDFSRISPGLNLTMKDNRLTLDHDRYRYTHLGLLGVARTFRNYPISDGVVALPDSVLPKNNPPKGLKPQLLGLFGFDHFSHRLTPPDGKSAFLPHSEIADAILGTIASKIQEGGQ